MNPLRRALAAYWSWNRGGSGWRLAGAIGGSILALLAIIALASGIQEPAQQGVIIETVNPARLETVAAVTQAAAVTLVPSARPELGIRCHPSYPTIRLPLDAGFLQT